MGASSRSDRIPALVLGSGNLPLGAVRAFGRKGTPVFAAAAEPGIERYSRWYRPVPGGWSGRHLASDLINCGLERAVLIPTSERDAIRAAELPSGLAERFPSSAPPADLLRIFADKEAQVELMEAHGLPLPRTWEAHSEQAIDDLADEDVPHVFLKPRDSGRFSAVFGRKALRPEGRAAMRHALREAREAGFEMLLQEYVPGPPMNCYLVDGFIDRHGVVRGLFARRRVRQQPPDFGNSSAVRSIALEDVRDMAETIVDFLRAIGYRGIFNAEFKRDTRDGTFRVFEINPRTWLYAEFASRCGFDALDMAYQDALGLPVASCTSYDVERLVVYPYYDLKALRRLRANREITLRQALGAWRGADQLLFVADDPRAGLMGTWTVLRDFIHRRLTGRKRKRPR